MNRMVVLLAPSVGAYGAASAPPAQPSMPAGSASIGAVPAPDARRDPHSLSDLVRDVVLALRVGFTESASWHGVVPDSLREFPRRHPEAEQQLSPLISRDQVEAVRSAGWMPTSFRCRHLTRTWPTSMSSRTGSCWLGSAARRQAAAREGGGDGVPRLYYLS